MAPSSARAGARSTRYTRIVAYFADLTPYSYGNPSSRDEPWPGLPLVNIGWLDADHSFATGLLPDGLLERLEELAKVRVRQSRGEHHCELCIRDLGGEAYFRRLEPATRNRELQTLPRESAEFRVKGRGVVYAVPQLAIHYLAAHGYLPPEEFREAVLA